MGDITKCSSVDCRESGWCWRKKGKDSDYQSYADFSSSCVVYRRDFEVGKYPNKDNSNKDNSNKDNSNKDRENIESGYIRYE